MILYHVFSLVYIATISREKYAGKIYLQDIKYTYILIRQTQQSLAPPSVSALHTWSTSGCPEAVPCLALLFEAWLVTWCRCVAPISDQCLWHHLGDWRHRVSYYLALASPAWCLTLCEHAAVIADAVCTQLVLPPVVSLEPARHTAAGSGDAAPSICLCASKALSHCLCYIEKHMVGELFTRRSI